MIKAFRKLSLADRKQFLASSLQLSEDEMATISGTDLADILIESAIGTFPIPLGLATGFLIDETEYAIPMAIEEPSVIAAASFAAGIIKAGGGFTTWSSEPIMTAQVYLTNCAQPQEAIFEAEHSLKEAVDILIPKMKERGGGYRSLEVAQVDSTLIVSIHVHVGDAMGANVANTIAEGLKNRLKDITGGNVLMAILTNASDKRRAKASFQVPEKYFRKNNFSGEEVCKKIVEANDLALKVPERAITHNKGIMNGISSLALATGNDTRAIESAAHFYAQKSGQYLPLTSYSYADKQLKGSLELPLPFGTIGGAVSFWPAAQFSLKLLGNPSSQKLSQIAASLGLAQNLAALFALVTEGIQSSHMPLHAAKLAFNAGARGEEIRLLASKLGDCQDLAKARERLMEMRNE